MTFEETREISTMQALCAQIAERNAELTRALASILSVDAEQEADSLDSADQDREDDHG